MSCFRPAGGHTFRVTKAFFVAAVGILFLSACGPDSQTDDRIKSVEKRLASLEEQQKRDAEVFGAIQEWGKGVDSRTGATQKEIEALGKMLVQEKFADKYVAVSLGESGYAAIDTGQGIVLVSCDNVETYLNGVRLHLRFGNPLTMAFSGGTIKFKLGSKPPGIAALSGSNGTSEENQWESSLTKKEVSFTDRLAPGYWTPVTVTVSDFDVKGLQYMEVAMSPNVISLMTAQPTPSSQ